MARKRAGARAASYWLVVASSKHSATTQHSKVTDEQSHYPAGEQRTGTYRNHPGETGLAD
ncbi:hypothetical protein L4D76_00510 [Photobacterium sagamiensis]|uniref:hypothetical protein n=1 Tax=Photobacterium sagamiensis TaxID=2910241 RepID=UPI003D0B45DE